MSKVQGLADDSSQLEELMSAYSRLEHKKLRAV